jgi:NTP pyrophosphatase (non-canonical NTP hydrolase)
LSAIPDDSQIALALYQQRAGLTDQNVQPGIEGLHLPMLGLFGEVGGLLSELKKKQRDKDSYVGYQDSVVEEFGDTLWYFTNICARAGLTLDLLAQRAMGAHAATPHSFADLQLVQVGSEPHSVSSFEGRALDLAAKTGILLQHFSVKSIDRGPDLLTADLTEILVALIQAADHAGISLDDAARRNLRKISSRWPTDRQFPAFFDAGVPAEEQLPRVLKVEIQEKVYGSRVFVMQQVNGINIGDRLTDNIGEPDDYRFHDVFHWSYAAILGWSPVTRALLKLKRKSSAALDENEDGARAQLIEEGTATWIFNHGRRLNFYENIPSVDYRLLKSIQDFVRGYEVERCALWLWEEAILQGFRAFRFLKQNRKGVLALDLNARKVSIAPL